MIISSWSKACVRLAWQVLLLASVIQGFGLAPPSRKACSKYNTCLYGSRRDFVLQWASLASVSALVTKPDPTFAASQVRIEQYPSLEYLEPVYELRLSVQALSQAAGDASKYPILRQRLEKFFKGGLVSERNYYAGLGVQYTGQIQYDKNELPEYIRMDKNERFNSMEDTLNSLKELLNNVKKDSPDASAIEECAAQAKLSLDRWFALVPPSDLDRVGKLFVAARQADANRNGRLEPEELASMSEEDRAVWQRRIDYVGG